MPLYTFVGTNALASQNVRYGSKADLPADGTARLLDYQELTSPIVDADVRLGPEAEVLAHDPQKGITYRKLARGSSAAPVTEAVRARLVGC